MNALAFAILSTTIGLVAGGTMPAAAAAAAAIPVPAAAAAEQRPAQHSPHLRGSQCLDPVFARGWVYLDDRHILVDAGRNRYRIEFSSYCRDIAFTPVIGFRGEPISGRVCGGPFDSVLTRDIPCRIQSMDLVSREEYKALETQRARDRAERRMQRRIKP